MKKDKKVIIDEFEERKLLALHDLQSTTNLDNYMDLIKYASEVYFSSDQFRELANDEIMRDMISNYNLLMEFFYSIKSITDQSGRPFSLTEQLTK